LNNNRHSIEAVTGSTPNGDRSSMDRRICTHVGDEYGRFHGAVVPPVYQNAQFVFADYDTFTKSISREKENYVYWRGTNPTVEIAERKLAALEGGDSCKCFSSGMAAICAAIMASTENGSHVVCAGHIYPETKKLLHYLGKFGVTYTLVPSPAIHAVEAAIRKETSLIYTESPTTHTFRLVDLSAVSAIAKSRGIRTIVDNTWATPLFQKPLRHGIDIVVHSCSKYLGGHSDLVGGAVIASEAIINRMFYKEYLLLGAAMAPFEASSLIKGLRTLPLRMAEHNRSTLEVARFLESHPQVSRVNYPALKSHPDYELGRRQLTGYSGLMSFELKNASYEAVRDVINRLELFQIGVSWGSFESLVLSPNEGNNGELLAREDLSPGLIRLSIGMEDTTELIADLAAALVASATAEDK
jgi:cystathionine beta-lyase